MPSHAVPVRGDLLRLQRIMHSSSSSRPRRLQLVSRFVAASLVLAPLALAPVMRPLAAQRIPSAAATSAITPPAVQREFRGAWVAAVANINWPSRPGLSTAAQQAELRTILDRAASTGLNAIVLHVRPAADALYASPYEPWSEYLTGQQGVPPDPYYDPLEFAVAEAHARGIELHAWFNPYRARHPSARAPNAPGHVSVTKPHWVRTYGRHLWMDPGEEEVRRHTIRVMADVARRYAVDGVHIDDYFYPYKERDAAGALIDFPDSVTYARYRRGGGTLARDDWRRDNVNRMVRELYEEIKRVKPTVKVGVSPFGIWRPGTPPSVRGFDPWAEIYADSRIWWHEGWLDYFVPQLYYLIDSPQPYPAVMQWWAGENRKNRHLWIGMATVNVGGSNARWTPAEIREQIRLTRAQEGVTGHVHWSEKGLHSAREIAAEALLSERATLDSLCACALDPAARDTLRTRRAWRDTTALVIRAAYREPALVPESPWLGARTAPGAPRISVYRDSLTGGAHLHVTGGTPGGAWLWVVQTRRDGAWHTRILPDTAARRVLLTRTAGEPLPEVVAVSGVSRMSVQGRPAIWRRPVAAGR